jgi:hypothetical protein
MDIYRVTGLVALATLVFSVSVFASRWTAMKKLPFGKDLSQPKDTAARGILYSFTLGMAPWSKESTRLHSAAYLRGIAFHIGIFGGLAALLASPWFDRLPEIVRVPLAAITGLGAVLGVAGGVMRIAEHNLKAISTPDDHAAVWLVTFFLAAMTAALLSTAFAPAMWLVSAAMLIYAPLGKIKHCIYFYFGRLFFGIHLGRRGIVSGMMRHALPMRHTMPASGEATHGK